MKIFRGVLLLILACAILSCDAPRLNPLDPLNKDYKFAQLDGFVQTYEQPRQAISKVTVTWKNQNVTVQTDSLGYYKITDVPRINGKVYFEKSGFSKDSVLIEWNNQSSKRVDNVLLSYTFGDLDGFIQNVDQQVIPKVKVFWENQKITVESDANGYFKIENVPIRNGMIYFEKEGFKTDTLWVEWKEGKSKRIDPRTLQYNIGDLEGFVRTPDLPYQPIENVKVRWKGLSTVSVTGTDGKYKFAQIPIKSGALYFEKDGFKYDSTIVQWSGIKVKQVEDKHLQYTHGNLSGTISTFDTPHNPVEKVFVRVKGLTTVAETNSLGEYLFANIPIGSGEIYYEKEGFKKDTVVFTWESGKAKKVDGFIKYNRGSIFGRVQTEKLPRQPIVKAKVYWKNQGIVKETEFDGSFKIESVPTNNGYLYFEKTGYSPDSLLIQWGTKNELTNQNVFLNAIPQLDSVAIFSSVQNKYPDIQTAKLTIQAKISDAENDVENVFVQNTQLAVYKQLEFNPSTKLFGKEFTIDELKVGSIDEVIGKNFEIVVEDVSKQKFTLGSSLLKRVIRQEIITYQPKDKAVVTVNPTFTWRRFEPGFNFKYFIEIYTDEIPAAFVWRSSLFSKEDVSFTIPTTLAAGSYYWVIYCVDDFQNRASSKPSTFEVK